MKTYYPLILRENLISARLKSVFDFEKDINFNEKASVAISTELIKIIQRTSDIHVISTRNISMGQVLSEQYIIRCHKVNV